MSGTILGGLKCAATNKKKYGKDFYRNIGRKGGISPKRQGPRGFALMTPGQRREAGAKGGRNSDRTGIKNGEGKKRR